MSIGKYEQIIKLDREDYMELHKIHCKYENKLHDETQPIWRKLEKKFNLDGKRCYYSNTTKKIYVLDEDYLESEFAERDSRDIFDEYAEDKMVDNRTETK